MNLEEAYSFLNFWINKYTGSYYTPEELDLVVDRGQMAYYSDLQARYATSQRIKDALAPFREVYAFSYADTLNGVVQIPGTDYLDLLDLETRYAVSGVGRTVHVPIKLYNEDERADRLNSQIDPVTATSPIGEQTGVGRFQLYPEVQYIGKATYLRRPAAPVFAYTVVSGRVIVYDSAASTQLEWGEKDIVPVLLKALSAIGINLSDPEIEQWSEAKNQQIFLNQNRS